MLSLSENHQTGIVEVILSQAWTHEADEIVRLVGPAPTRIEGTPKYRHSVIQELCLGLHRKAPRFSEMADAIKSCMADSNYVIIARKLGISEFDHPIKRKILYALASLMGIPSPPSPRSANVVWDVKVHSNLPQEDYLTSFSEHCSEAEYHTDRQYTHDPERYFFLYVVKPAECMGGVSFFQNAVVLKHKLSSTEKGRAAVGTLSCSPIPFRVPTTFANAGDQPEVITATLFGEKVFIRWRLDTIKAGLEACPGCCSPEAMEALETMTSLVYNPEAEYRDFLPQDAVCFVDNHHVLHGRTSYKDPERHLIRLAMYDDHQAQAQEADSNAPA